MCRSSIFSFDGIERPTRLPKGLLFALALLLAVEVLLARNEWFWHQIPRSSAGVIDALEKRVIGPARAPSVVLLGNSRLRDAIAPRLLEKELNLAKGTVLNLALTGGTPFDSRTLYARNRAKLSRAACLVVDYEMYFFTRRPHLPNDRIQRFATLKDRLRLFRGTRDLGPSLIGYFWQTYGVARSLEGWKRNGFHRQTESVIGEDGRVEWRASAKFEDEGAARKGGPVALDAVEHLGIDLRGGPVRTESRDEFLRLVNLARADGVCVALVVVPLRDAAVDRVQRTHPESYEVVRNAVLALGEEVDALLFLERARDLGISDADFVDYGHLTPRGGSIMTQRLGRFLIRQFGEFTE